MNLYHLRYFSTLAHIEHYTKAADILAITQPSLSYAISTLEEELGVKLFEKNGRNVTLTKYGKVFLNDVEEVLNRLDSSVNSLKLAGKGEGCIDVVFLRTLGIDFLPKIMRGFLEENPTKKIDFNLYCDKVLTSDILNGLKEKKYDLGFCSKLDNEPLIEFIPVARQELVVIVPPDHPLAVKDEIRLEDTIPYKQIIFKKRSGLRQIIDGLFECIGQTPDVAYEIDEEELGVKLFEKNGRNVTLTKYGKVFLNDVEEVLNRLDSSVNSLKLAGKGEGCIDVVFLRTLGIDFLPKIMRGFLEENPTKKIDFNLYCDKVLTSDILNGLKEKKYDLGFCSKLDNEPLIEFIPVARQELVVIVPPDHPLAVKDEIRLEDTIPYKQIIFKKRSGLRQIIDGLFECIGQTPDVAYEIDEDQVAAGFVSNGFGICVAPNIPILQSLNVKILPLVSPSWQRNFYMAMLKNVYHPPVVEAFKNYVIEQAQKEWDYKTS